MNMVMNMGLWGRDAWVPDLLAVAVITLVATVVLPHLVP